MIGRPRTALLAAMVASIVWHVEWRWLGLPLRARWDIWQPFFQLAFLGLLFLIQRRQNAGLSLANTLSDKTPQPAAQIGSAARADTSIESAPKFDAIITTLIRIDCLIALLGLATPLCMRLELLDDQWIILGVFFLTGLLLKSGILFSSLFKATVIFSKRWYWLLACVAFYGLLGVQQWIMTVSTPDGDEPYYMLIAESIIRDHDLDITNNFVHRDYAAYYPHQLKEFYFQQEGKNVPSRPPGLPLLIAPGMAVAGWRGALWMIALCGVLALILWLQLVHELYGSSARSGAILALTLFGAYPLIVYCTRIYPEMPAALLGLLLVRLAIRPVTISRTVIAAAAVASLPALKPRLLLLGLPFFLLQLWQYRAFRKNHRVAMLAGLSVLFIFIACFVFVSKGGIYFSYHMLEVLHASWSNYKPWQGVFGILLDQQFGLLLRNPLYFFLLCGLLKAIAGRDRITKRIIWCLLPYFAAIVSVEFWTGGSNPPPRFIVAILPILGLAAGLHLVRMRANWIVALGATCAIAATISSLLMPQADYYQVDPPHGLARLLGALGRQLEAPVGWAAPAFFRPSLATSIAPFLLVLLLVLFLKRGALIDRFHSTSWPQTFGKSACLLLLLLLALVAIIRLKPVTLIYPSDRIYGNAHGNPAPGGYEIKSSYRFQTHSVAGPGHVVVWASSPTASLPSAALRLTIDGQDYGKQEISQVTNQPYLWPTRFSSGQMDINLAPEASTAGQPSILINHLELLPQSALVSFGSLAMTRLFSWKSSVSEQYERLIRAFVLDSDNKAAGNRLARFLCHENDYLDLLPWLQLNPAAMLSGWNWSRQSEIASQLQLRGLEGLLAGLAPPFEQQAPKPAVSEVGNRARSRAAIPHTESALTSPPDNTTKRWYRSAKHLLNVNQTEAAIETLQRIAATRDPMFAALLASDPQVLAVLPAYRTMFELDHLDAPREKFSSLQAELTPDGWLLASNGSVYGMIPVIPSLRFASLRLRGSPAMDEWPEALILLDGTIIGRFSVSSVTWHDYTVALPADFGLRLLEIRFTNDFFYPKDQTDRNLFFQGCTLVDTSDPNS